jgi:hypothetical protein
MEHAMAVDLAVYGGPASWRGDQTGGYTGFVAAQGYLQAGPVQYSPPTATLFGHPFPVDLLGYADAARSNNTWVFVYNFLAPAGFGGLGSAGLWVEHELNTFLASTRGSNSDGSSAQTGTLGVYLADLATVVSAKARLLDASITSDKRFFGNLELQITWLLFEDLHS